MNNGLNELHGKSPIHCQTPAKVVGVYQSSLELVVRKDKLVYLRAVDIFSYYVYLT
jgi:hypothetical protein